MAKTLVGAPWTLNTPASPRAAAVTPAAQTLVAVIWIDWYPYHVARFAGMLQTPLLAGRTVGIELVGGVGVHTGLKFREDLPEGLPIETLLPDTAWREAGQWRLARLLWRKLSDLDPEVVLVPGYYTLPALAAAVWARLHGSASVLMTESTAGDHRRVWWRERIKSLGLRTLFGWAVAGGQAHVSYLRELGFPLQQVRSAYDVVDNRRIREGTAALRQRSSASAESLPETPYFLFVGRLAPEKNVAGLVHAWLRYRLEGGAWPLVLAGDGPERAALHTLLAESPFAADVHFAGLRPLDALLPLYAFAGCFVLPSTLEPWGLVVNEAMTAGLPVLVSDRCGCAPDLVSPGESGYRFDPLDTPALTILLHAMQAMPATERARMGQASLSRIDRFRPEDFGASVASIVSAVQTSQGVPQTAAAGAAQ